MVYHSFFIVFHETGFQRTGFQRTGYPSMNIIDGYPAVNINGYPVLWVPSLWAPWGPGPNVVLANVENAVSKPPEYPVFKFFPD